jgi:DNA repair photolyase
MLLVASSRTDIPAFYSEWFMNRLREEYALIKNPFNDSYLSKVPITSENVDCILFITKNFRPMMRYVDELIEMNHFFMVDHTLTSYHEDIEGNVLNKKEIIKSIKLLSEKIGKERITLRYDPIIITSRYSMDYHKVAFEKIVVELAPYVDHFIISFVDLYDKTKRNMSNIDYVPFTKEMMYEISKSLSEVARRYNVEIRTCAEDINLCELGIKKAKCIDAARIEKLLGCDLVMSSKTKHIESDFRTTCACHKHIDIGEYDTCLFNCKYCYANSDFYKSEESHKSHDPKSPVLIGNQDGYKIIERNEKDTKSYKQQKIEQFNLFE